METKRYGITVTGRVQGVGYRFFTRDAASSLGLYGWVRNVVGGGVEMEVEGGQAAVDAFVKRLWEGPPLARVVSVDAYPMVAMGAGGEFVIRR